MIKKSILQAAFVAAIAAVAASCGSSGVDANDPESLKDNVIEMAEKDVALEETPIVGTMPAIYAQRKAALDSLKAIKKEALEKTMPQSESEVESALKKAEQINTASEAAEDAVKAYFDTKLQDRGKQFIGKEFPCKFDAAQYSSATAKITKFEDGRCYADVELTLSAPIQGSVKYIIYDFLDADGKVVNSGADYKIDYKNCEKGSKFTKEISMQLTDLAKITVVNFKKSK